MRPLERGSPTDPHLPRGAAPVSFSDAQLELLIDAAASIPRWRRDAFLRAVAAELFTEPTDHDVQLAVAGASRG
jgi:hypothetical protein